MCRQADTATHTRKKRTEQKKTNVSRKTKRKPLRPVSTGSNLGLGLGELKQNWSCGYLGLVAGLKNSSKFCRVGGDTCSNMTSSTCFPRIIHKNLTNSFTKIISGCENNISGQHKQSQHAQSFVNTAKSGQRNWKQHRYKAKIQRKGMNNEPPTNASATLVNHLEF
jgi:hypothetical protein